MLQRLRERTCQLFGHETELVSPEQLTTALVCSRCGLAQRYEWVVEPGFLDNEFPPEEDDRK
jgi:hypothetical protein